MQEKIYEFAITQPLTAARRKAILSLIQDNAHRSPWPVGYEWDESGTRLMVTSKPMNLDIVFHPAKIEVFREAPLWGRLLVTKKKQADLQQSLLEILDQLGFFKTRKSAKPGKIRK